MEFDPLSVGAIESEDDHGESEEDVGFAFEFHDTALVVPRTKKVAIDLEDEEIAEDEEMEPEKIEDESLFEQLELQEVVQDEDELLEDTLTDKPIQKPAEINPYFEVAPQSDVKHSAFSHLNLSRPLLKAVTKLGWISPTPIQSRAIPLALQGRDLCGSAQTGSGKTAAFIIPVLERLLFRPRTRAATRVLVLVPTRELGSQVMDVTRQLAEFSSVVVSLCVGGLPVKQQEQELRKNPDIVIATPGRLIDHIHNSPSFTLDQIEILIMDEADRMLEDGFAAELAEIIKNTPKKRQTMLFSATMTDNVNQLISLSLTRPIRLHVDTNTQITNKLVQEFIRVRGHREDARPAILAALCQRTYKSNALIFFRSKAQAHHMSIILNLLGLKCSELHGNLTQPQRIASLEKFRSNQSQFLLCTDLASRGLDIAGIKTVINYDMPSTYQVYVHRVGRTARASEAGRAVSLVGETGRSILKLALENSSEAVKHRIIPAPIIQKYEKILADLKDEITGTYAEEKHEREIGKMEMQVAKAENIMLHEKEIMARPRREWFQSESERQSQKLKDAPAPAVKNAPKRGGMDGLSRHKKRLRQGREEDKQEMAQQKVAARSMKKSVRAQKIPKFMPGNDGAKKGGAKKGKVFEKEMKKRR